ncbi:MAG: hypothetical protein ACLP56_12895, partial [Candidatus Sulfotelmatobacter sp.]
MPENRISHFLSDDTVASGQPKPHNRPVAETVWQQRIRRAETLAAQHPFAMQILSFYIQTARFQQDLYDRLERGSAGVPPA